MRVHRSLAILDATSAAVNAEGSVPERVAVAQQVLADHGFGGDLEALDEAVKDACQNYKDDILTQLLIQN